MMPILRPDFLALSFVGSRYLGKRARQHLRLSSNRASSPEVADITQCMQDVIDGHQILLPVWHLCVSNK